MLHDSDEQSCVCEPETIQTAHTCLTQNELITRLGAGGQSGRAATAEKALERMREEGLVSKPFVPKKRSFAFPSVERMGCARAASDRAAAAACTFSIVHTNEIAAVTFPV
jgi:hypothetical protein